MENQVTCAKCGDEIDRALAKRLIVGDEIHYICENCDENA